MASFKKLSTFWVYDCLLLELFFYFVVLMLVHLVFAYSVINILALKWKYPHCFGTIDGKHITIVAPQSSGTLHYNYKNTHSIVFMGVADAHYKLIYVDIGCNGRISDGRVFTNCSLHHGRR